MQTSSPPPTAPPEPVRSGPMPSHTMNFQGVPSWLPGVLHLIFGSGDDLIIDIQVWDADRCALYVRDPDQLSEPKRGQTRCVGLAAAYRLVEEALFIGTTRPDKERHFMLDAQGGPWSRHPHGYVLVALKWLPRL